MEIRKNNYDALKIFFTILMGIGLENYLNNFIIQNKLNSGVLFYKLFLNESGAILLFISTLILIIRYFHINIHLLSEKMYLDNYKIHYQVIDWIVITLQGAIVSVLGFYVSDLVNFQILILSIFLIHILWLLSNKKDKKENSEKIVFSTSLISFITSLILALVTLGYYLQGIGKNFAGILFAIVILVSSFIDYFLHRKTYFPIG